MASVTLALDEKLKSEMNEFSWINWSELAKEELSREEKIRKMLKELRERLESGEEKELIKWSVELGRKAKKDSFKRLLSELPLKRREELLKKLSSDKRQEILEE